MPSGASERHMSSRRVGCTTCTPQRCTGLSGISLRTLDFRDTDGHHDSGRVCAGRDGCRRTLG
jgi:hypothetical protein